MKPSSSYQLKYSNRSQLPVVKLKALISKYAVQNGSLTLESRHRDSWQVFGYRSDAGMTASSIAVNVRGALKTAISALQ
jgi:hypothetical protein